MTQNTDEIKVLNERMALAFSGYDAGYWEWNLIDNSGYYSPQWKKMLGYALDEPLLNNLSTWAERVHPDEIEKLISEVEEALKGKNETIESVHRLKHKDGRWLWILGRGLIQYDNNGNALRMVGIHTNITKQKILEIKAIERGKILDNSLNEIYMFDSHTLQFLYLNKGASNNLGYSLEEIVAFTPLDIKPEMTKEQFLNSLNPIIQGDAEHINFSTVHQRKDGSKYYVDVYLQATIFEEKSAYVAIILDVTERKNTEIEVLKQNNILHHQAHHHTLTGLPNRVLFTNRLEQSIVKGKRHEVGFALFFLDLDKFKMINDSYGHGVGDSVLKEVAARLQKVIRIEDTVAHISGDEFTIIMEDLRRVEDAAILAQKIIDVLKESIEIDNNALYISASIGISLYPDDDQAPQNLLKYADTAMYEVKKEGRNNFKYYNKNLR